MTEQTEAAKGGNGETDKARRAWYRLTAREREAAGLTAQGRTPEEVAQALGVGLKTAYSHRSNAVMALQGHGTGVRNVSDLTWFALRFGLVPMEERNGAAEADLRRTWSELTPRQRAVAVRFAQGETGAVIALDLGLSLKTVEDYRGGAIRNLQAVGIRNNSDLTWLMLRLGIISMEDRSLIEPASPPAEPAPQPQQ